GSCLADGSSGSCLADGSSGSCLADGSSGSCLADGSVGSWQTGGFAGSWQTGGFAGSWQTDSSDGVWQTGSSGAAGQTDGQFRRRWADGQFRRRWADGQFKRRWADGQFRRRWADGHTCREETERQPGAWGCHRTHQAGETYRRLDVKRHLKDRAVGEYWSSGAQPWHHSPRLEYYTSPYPPECRHRLNRAVDEHWRSSAYYAHFSLRLHYHICPVRAERRHRTHCTLPALRRHSTQSRRRIPWTETAYRRPDALSRHNTPRLDAHTHMTLSGVCSIAHRAMGTHWRHRALNRITRCLTSDALLIISTRSALRSATWLSHTPL
ncbi:uncharacterized protein ACWYII_034276, partial [Salvelinus alpinus]